MRHTTLTLPAPAYRARLFAGADVDRAKRGLFLSVISRLSGRLGIEAKLQNRANEANSPGWQEFHNALSERPLEREIETSVIRHR